MHEIREKRPHICIICSKGIFEAEAVCFAHVLDKGMYPKYRAYTSNIVLVCSHKCHHELDHIKTGHKRQIEEVIEDYNAVYYIIKSLIVIENNHEERPIDELFE
jgi:predicted nucleic acid-binding Zn ribbon protein